MATFLDHQWRRARAAASRRQQWDLTPEQYRSALGDGVCHYCQEQILTAGVGLDRKDNSLGYVVGNVVPCCATCNTEKGGTISYDEYEWLWKYRRSRRAAMAEVASRIASNSPHRRLPDHRSPISDRADKRKVGLDVNAPWPDGPREGETLDTWRARTGLTVAQAAAVLRRQSKHGWSVRSLYRKRQKPIS